MVDDAWKAGYFEGTEVFLAADPGGAMFILGKVHKSDAPALASRDAQPDQPAPLDPKKEDPGDADMRIDLSRIGVK
jgi:TraH_2